MEEYGTLLVQTDGPVARVVLNRPEVRNAFNAEMIGELTSVFLALAESPVRVVVLSGAGKSFSAGADVNWMRASLDWSRAENVQDARKMSDMFAAINMLPVPVVAQVHGAALGGGLGLIAVCDVVVAADDVVFGFTEAKLGIMPSVISRFVVPKIGPTWARALFLTAERFGPDVAQRIGLVHWITPARELEATVQQKVDDILTSGPGAVRAAKDLIEGILAREPEERREYTAQLIADLRTGEEGQAGLRAFLEKSKPPWALS